MNLFSKEPKEELKYPRAIPLILLNEFCERFSYYGLRAILIIYLNNKLKLEESDASLVYHLFIVLLYSSCIIGVILADSFVGKFMTIFLLSIVCAAGHMIMSLGAIESLDLTFMLTIVGLSLTAIGSGGIKTCVSAFGGDQFKLPEQSKQMSTFFLIFYLTINAGSFISMVVTPILREEVKCFGMDDCYPMGFGVPLLSMLFSILFFVTGGFICKFVPSEGKLVFKVLSCIFTAIRTKIREKSSSPREHWLDYAEAKHGKRFVLEMKIFLNVLVLFAPLPLFWALYEQQGSRWTLQATKMDYTLGNTLIRPDQIQAVNPLLILIFVPLCDYYVYPFLRFLRLGKPMHKMCLGGMLAGLSFIVAMIIQHMIDCEVPSTVSVLWQLPQYVILSLAEVIFSVNGLEFSYSQTPPNMKRVVTACWLLTIAFGNVFVSFIVGFKAMPGQFYEFLFFGCLMFLDMVIFVVLAYRYKPIDLAELDKIKE